MYGASSTSPAGRPSRFGIVSTRAAAAKPRTLWRTATSRMRTGPRTKEYVTRRRREGKTGREIIPCPKGHIVREIYGLLTNPYLP